MAKSILDNNSSVRRAKSEAEFRPKLDIALVKELIEIPAKKIVLLTEAQAVERAVMAMSYAAGLYAKYYGVLVHLAGNKFKEWDRYAPVVKEFWELFKKGYVVLGTALPEGENAGESGMGTTYACAKLRDTDVVKGGHLLEIRS